jgi:hypothetical protein
MLSQRRPESEAGYYQALVTLESNEESFNQDGKAIYFQSLACKLVDLMLVFHEF